MLPKLAVAHCPGPCWVRTGSETAGPRRARAVNVGEAASQVRGRSPSRPRTANQPGAGFEPLTRTGAVPLPCHSQQSRAVPSEHLRGVDDDDGQCPGGHDLCRSSTDQVAAPPDLALQARSRWSRLALVLPASCSRRPSPCAWFEPTRGWGITMPLTRDGPSI